MQKIVTFYNKADESTAAGTSSAETPEIIQGVPTNLIKKETKAKKDNPFEKYKNMPIEQLSKNQGFQEEAATELKKLMLERTMNDSTGLARANFGGDLPSGKILEQYFEEKPTQNIYEEFINMLFSPRQFVPAGEGQEHMLETHPKVREYNPVNFIPQQRDDLQPQLNVAKIELSPIIYQAQISITETQYVAHFISGKVAEAYEIFRKRNNEAIDLVSFGLAFKLLKQIVAKIITETPSTPTAITNYYKSDAKTVVDAIGDFRVWLYNITNHNRKFAYDKTNFKGYSNAGIGELGVVTSNDAFYNVSKIETTFYADDRLREFSKKLNWQICPLEMANPMTQELEKIDIFNGKKNQILVLQKNGLKRLYNFEADYVQFFGENHTQEFWSKLRPTYAILPWTQVGIFECDGLLEKFVN